MSVVGDVTAALSGMFTSEPKKTYGEGPMTKPLICDSIMDCIGGTPMVILTLTVFHSLYLDHIRLMIESEEDRTVTYIRVRDSCEHKLRHTLSTRWHCLFYLHVKRCLLMS